MTTTYKFNPSVPPNWVEGSVLGVCADYPGSNARIYCPDPYIATPYSVPPYPVTIPVDQWTTVDISAIIPPDTKAVFLSAVKVMTHGTTPETAAIYAAFRRTGMTQDPLPPPAFCWESVCVLAAQGVRANASIWVPVITGQFDMKWWLNSNPQPGGAPLWTAYAINLYINAYLR
jgi:hypothetical protein